MIFKILRFLLKLLLVFAKIVIITSVFEKKRHFFAENWQKSQKIVIITSTPGRAASCDTERHKYHCSRKQTLNF
jgi:hypothetical protein